MSVVIPTVKRKLDVLYNFTANARPRAECIMHVWHNIAKNEESPLYEIRVFGLSLLEDGNVRVRIFPERKEILIGRSGFGLIAR